MKHSCSRKTTALALKYRIPLETPPTASAAIFHTTDNTWSIFVKDKKCTAKSIGLQGREHIGVPDKNSRCPNLVASTVKENSVNFKAKWYGHDAPTPMYQHYTNVTTPHKSAARRLTVQRRPRNNTYMSSLSHHGMNNGRIANFSRKARMERRKLQHETHYYYFRQEKVSRQDWSFAGTELSLVGNLITNSSGLNL